MSATLPVPSACCNPCASPVVVNIPGINGAPGTNGINGLDGINAFTLTQANFTVPAELANVTVTVGDSDWIAIGEPLFTETAGVYQVVSTPTNGSVVLKNLADTPNLKYSGNAAPGTVIAANSKVTPTGFQGPGPLNGGSVGTGSPEGVVTANPGATYLDTTVDPPSLWAKASGTGNTGWKQLIALWFFLMAVLSCFGQPILRTAITTNGPSGPLLTYNKTNITGIHLLGWDIDTPLSPYEGPARTFRIHSMGTATSLTDNTGDGYLQLESNLATRDSAWYEWRGSIAMQHTNRFETRIFVLQASSAMSLSAPSITLGANTNMLGGVLLTRAGVFVPVGLPKFSITGPATNPATFLTSSNFAVGGTLFGGTTPTANATTSGEDLMTTVIPAEALTNYQDAITFEATVRYALKGENKSTSIIFGSTTIFTTGSQALSNINVLIEGRIVNGSTAKDQYVYGKAYFNGLGGVAPFYSTTNWTAYIAETNWVDTVLKVRATNGVAGAATNEAFQVQVRRAPSYTF